MKREFPQGSGRPLPAGCDDKEVPRLALRPRDAARAIGISERLLWSRTNAGEVPHFRIGKAVIYPVDLLRDWLAQQAQGGAA